MVLSYEKQLSNDLAKITEDQSISVVAVLLGGLEPARTYVNYWQKRSCHSK